MITTETISQQIDEGRTVLGIELGSTRIKAVLTNERHEVIASGSYQWNDQLIGNAWSYRLEDAWIGLQSAYAQIANHVLQEYRTCLRKVACIGISAMMHGYLVFDKHGRQLTEFRTWRNTITETAAHNLSSLFGFNIPQRWSVCHLYQAILNGENHVSNINFMTTLSGYIHWQLTGQRVLGIGDASGMFPIKDGQYHPKMLEQFSHIPEVKCQPWTLEQLLPTVLSAGEDAGTLTEKGARLLDPSGQLCAGVPLCPPEGDAGTGMIATNSIQCRSGNISAGTSVFAMAVLEHEPSHPHPSIDIVCTPNGRSVAMIHCNTCTSDLNAWIELFREFAKCLHVEISDDALFGMLYRKALEGQHDCDGIVSYCHYAGEPVMGTDAGCPIFLRPAESKLSLANFMRAHLYAAVSTLRVGLDILAEQENIKLDYFTGHGGFFKTPNVGQHIMATALNTPITVMETAGEGGAWGISLLADYCSHRELSLDDYLRDVFQNSYSNCVKPDPSDTLAFSAYLDYYRRALPIEELAGRWYSEYHD